MLILLEIPSFSIQKEVEKGTEGNLLDYFNEEKASGRCYGFGMEFFAPAQSRIWTQVSQGAIDILVHDMRKGGTDISPTGYGEKLVCSSYLFGL